MRTEIPVQGSLLDELSRLFFWEEERERPSPILPPGTARHMVARVNGLTIKIWADEHPPPHFHVSFQGRDASFSINDCSRLPGARGLEKYEHAIYRWWEENRHTLIEVWNTSRPTDCPVGPIAMPPLPPAKKSFEETETEMGDLISRIEELTKKLRDK